MVFYLGILWQQPYIDVIERESVFSFQTSASPSTAGRPEDRRLQGRTMGEEITETRTFYFLREGNPIARLTPTFVRLRASSER